MYGEELVLKIRPLLIEHLEKGGYCLVDLRFYKNFNHEMVFEVLADRQEGGITLDECARLNKELGEIVESSGYLRQSYTLGVSSPGLDRPLVTFLDFRRVIGRQVRLFLREPVAEKIEHCGAIESVDEDKIILKTDTNTIDIPLDKVNKAKQVIL